MKYLILEAGASADAQDLHQRTALFWCLRNPYYPPLRHVPVTVFQDRASFTHSDKYGHSLVHLAVLRSHAGRHEDTVRLIARLVEAGANVNQRNRRLHTPLFYLVQQVSDSTVQLASVLVNYFGADVNICDGEGYTVVHLAAVLGRLDLVALFLPKMKWNIITPTGETVRSCVTKHCCPSVDQVDRLLKELETKEPVVSCRTYCEPLSNWRDIQTMAQLRNLVSLYHVDTFFRYRGGTLLRFKVQS